MSLTGKNRWTVLALLAAAELLGMSLWFVGSAVAGELGARWQLDAGEIGWLTAIVQLGFVAGTALAALLNLADIIPARTYYAASAIAGAMANAGLVAAPSYGTALGCRFATGVFLAGIYPPVMKMVATWFRSDRGLAIGGIVGALTVGSASPYLVTGLPGIGTNDVVLIASLAAVLAAAIVWLGYRDGPFPFPRRPFSWRLVFNVLRHRETRLAIGGYLGHMWELYAVWTWVPAFLAASAAARIGAGLPAPGASVVSALGSGMIAVGGIGCVWGGWWAGRVGYTRVVSVAMAASGACALLIGLGFGASFWVLVPVAWIWGFFVVADSAQFSALVTEVAPAHAVGTALTVQTSLGFLLTMATIQGVPVVVDAAGWRWAFPLLALGPAAGIATIARLGAGRRGGR